MVWSGENSDALILIFGTSVLVMLVIAFVSFYLSYQKRLLKEQNRAQALELDLQRKVMAAIIDTQEIERKRMAEDMHDELGALILALKLSNHQLLQNKEDQERREERIKTNEEMIESIANRVRQVSHNLLPPALKSGHFETALETLCKMMDESTELTFVYEHNGRNSEISQKDQISLYRVVNEWFTNVVKHSKAKKVEVAFHKKGDEYVIHIKDDGKDFDFMKALETQKGLGLMSIDGRLKQMDAGYAFKKNDPKGTWLEIKYPAV